MQIPTNQRRRRGFRPVSEVNVTPLVDVMLVLLIIFMITAPMMTVGIKVDLPQTNAPALVDQSTPVVVTLKADGTLYIQETLTPLDALSARLDAVTHHKKDTKIYLRADKTISYGQAMDVMAALAAAGFIKVALIGEQKN